MDISLHVVQAGSEVTENWFQESEVTLTNWKLKLKVRYIHQS